MSSETLPVIVLPCPRTARTVLLATHFRPNNNSPLLDLDSSFKYISVQHIKEICCFRRTKAFDACANVFLSQHLVHGRDLVRLVSKVLTITVNLVFDGKVMSTVFLAQVLDS